MNINEWLVSSSYLQSQDDRVWQREGYESIDYSDGDQLEEGLLATLRAADDVSVFSPELAAACVSWHSRYHFSAERANLLRPFASYLQPGKTVLEIGAGCGAVTRYLGESGATVLALEGSLRRARIARERTRELDNVVVMAERFQDFAPGRRFDVVTLIGVLEYASLFSQASRPALHMLEVARGMLVPGGRLILAIENKLGLKYMAGVPEDHLGQPMVGLEDRYPAIGARTYGRHELNALLREAGFARARFSVPLPDYKLPSSVLTERGATVERETFDAGTLLSQAVRRDPQLTPTTFNLQRTWPVVADNQLTLDLANSFLIEAVEGADALIEETALAYHYSTQRLAPYVRETCFELDLNSAAVLVHSRALMPQLSAGKGDVRQQVQEHSDYVRGRLLIDDIRDVLSQPKWKLDSLTDAIRRYLHALEQALREQGHAVILDNVDAILPDDFTDATPSNLVQSADGRIVYFDREWITPRPTLGWLLLRSLLFAYGGTVVAPMADSGDISVRGLLLDVFAHLFGAVEGNAFEHWIRRELAFQRQVTGKDQSEAISGMLDALVPRADIYVPEQESSPMEQGFASLQHSLNLAAQHGINTYALISDVRTALQESFGKAEPALERVEAIMMQLAEGQAALHERLVGTDDRLEDSIRHWSAEQSAVAEQLQESLRAEQRQETVRALEVKVEAMAATQTDLIAAYQDMLQRLQKRPWWKFW